MAEYLMPEKKQEIFAKYGKSNKDTGSPESQVALFSYRIAESLIRTPALRRVKLLYFPTVSLILPSM